MNGVTRVPVGFVEPWWLLDENEQGVTEDPGGGETPGQAGDLDASDRMARINGVTSLVRRSAFCLAFILLGAL